ncbi:SDR family NAD(P)-dependent oxidoreductase [Alteribacillus sp. YIM 98480]|uniref:SDR family NAD(P)-dependent oxidoreductase n=1 Tax=Alteribacillus sp. YIM 98480 TaxID=2606599 RepID=UPI00131C2689|nr:glucose 1-dehydrogenase [Alteribacillus sp. YIM 98480]
MKLKNKVAIVTGGASGIGRALAETYNREGAKVMIVDLPNSEGQEVVKLLNEKNPQTAKFYPVDITKENEVEKLVVQVTKDFEKIDILHNNAGIGMEHTNIEEMDTALFDNIINVNLKGSFLCTKAIVPIMKKARDGVILFTGSTGAIRPRDGLSIYNASKGGLIAFSKTISLELASYGIRVNCVNPSATDTKMLTPTQRKEFIKNIPLGKIADPGDIAETALFLVSNEASMITGIDIEVDGGRCV